MIFGKEGFKNFQKKFFCEIFPKIFSQGKGITFESF